MARPRLDAAQAAVSARALAQRWLAAEQVGPVAELASALRWWVAAQVRLGAQALARHRLAASLAGPASALAQAAPLSLPAPRPLSGPARTYE